MAETTSLGVGGATRTQEDWEKAARTLLDDGQNFLAHDVCREGLKAYPGNFKLITFGAIALSQTGALDEARRLLAPVLDELLIDEGPFRRLQTCLKGAIHSLDSADTVTSLAAMADLAEAIDLVRGKRLVATADAETYDALARVFREAWLSSGERRDLEHCRDLFLRAFRTNHHPRDGVEAAVMSRLLGDPGEAHLLAAEVKQIMAADEAADISTDVRYRIMATLGQAHLLLGETEEAIATFQQAHALEGVHYGRVVAALKQLDLLRQGGVEVPDEISDLVKPPTVVVFTGHALDRPGEGPHFPPGLEAAVRAEIAAQLEELNAQVGYSMAACGSDLLFIEAMLERGAEVNVVMPFAMDDFSANEVRYGGPRWEMRFRNALKLAASVTYATEERYLGHDMLYRFANQCLHGLATLRSGFLLTSPYLLAVWDMMPGSLVGGAGDFIDQWEDITRLRIVDLDGLLQQRPDLIGPDGPALPNLDFGGDEEEGEGRVIRSMLFCDIAGYSRLKEEHTPAFLEFMGRLKEGMAAAGAEPISINTWGDAIFVVMDKASPLAEYALTMQEVVTRLGTEMLDVLPNPLNLRISLHAGPVFEAVDPICGRKNFYGSHINRAARLEPVTVIGHVYATQQFVAVLTAEQSALRSVAVSNGEEFVEKYVSEYVGVLSLAKDFGKQTVYHLRRRMEHVIQPTAETPPADITEEAEVPVPEPEPEVVADEPEPAATGDDGIIERPAPGVESVLATVAKLMARAESGETTSRKGRKKKAKDTPVVIDGDEPFWPGT
ncbi:MAG TPA: adenylate/guanylate cyclase domain-containing protein [Magnetospirillum sp.]|nr:adenylate/guanylate cyclase domain-containing protein [Magnetospirillum sp.]